VKGRSGRTVLAIVSGLFDVTAKRIGARDFRQSLQDAMIAEHLRRTKVPESHYSVFLFDSPRAMRRALRQSIPSGPKTLDIRWH